MAMTLEVSMKKSLLLLVVLVCAACNASFELSLGSKKSSLEPASQSASLAVSLPASAPVSKPTFLVGLKDKAADAWGKIDDVSISGGVKVQPELPKIEVEITTPSTGEIFLRFAGIVALVMFMLWVFRQLFGTSGRGRRSGGSSVGGSSSGDGWGSGGGIDFDD